jgi:hypothetical protein
MKRTTTKRTTLRTRAEAIINSTAYDTDTRRALELSLERGDAADIREMVRRAEAGDTICDLTDNALARRELAAHVAAVIAHPDTPVGLYNCIVERLCDMERRDYTNAAEVERILVGNAEEIAELYGVKQ